ncbi:MAG: LPS export ABC transporter periplasmic protein LptC [Deltaproteobacteria bacterium]|nr:LPS export ABC transporter periplasmic protein LptC [Deltaproteobacteria bacterium]
MKKSPLKYWPIAAIMLFLMVIGFYLIRAQYESADNLIVTDLIPGEGLRLKNIQYIQNNPDEGVKWVLDAKEVRFSKDRQRISFKNFRLKLEPENSPSIELEGRGGDYNKDSSEISLRGDLHAYTDNGYRITTEHILYRQKEGYLNTEEPVKITGPFFTLTGRGLYLNLEKETLRVISDVETLIKRESFAL